ncbi:hypothetical protein L7F22_008960 [Adiantum nelumboides]|nr:hypothetical protein [Adiantum nelumboides]
MMAWGKVATRIAFGSAEAEPFIEVKFVGGNKCGDQVSKVLGHAEKEGVLDKEAKLDAKVEIVGCYNCEEQYPKVEVHVEKEGVLEKDSPENGDQAKNCPSMKDNEVSTGDTSPSISPSILQTIQMMQRERKKRMTDAATSNIDNLDHIISMIAKSTMKNPLDVDTSFRVEGQVPCASNIEDQEDKNIEFFALNTGEDTEIIIKKFEPPQEIGDASVEIGGDASCASGAVGAGEDMEIISEKFEPPQENGDASMHASGDAICVGGAVGAGEDTAEPPQENGDASMDASGDASCGGGAVGAGEDMEIIIEKYEPPQENGDPSVDAGGDASCASGAVGASAVEYVRHNDGTMPHSWEDGDDARGVAGYVRNDDGMVSHPWEDPRNILFESKTAIILDINGVLLTLVDKRYHSQMPAYWRGLEIVDKARVFGGYKRDAPAFLH